MPRSALDQAQDDVYGAEVIDEGLALCDDEDATTHHVRPKRKGEPMTYSEDELHACLDSINKDLDRVEDMDAIEDDVAAIGKSLARLQSDLVLQDLDASRVRAELRGMRQAIKAIYHESRQNRAAAGRLAKSVERFTEALAARAPAPRHAGVAGLAKSLLPPGTPLHKQVEAVLILKSWFGASGGQRIRYSATLCADLRMAKAITATEEARWRRSGLLPDRVNVAQPSASPTVERFSDAEIAAGYRRQQYAPLLLDALRLR